MRYMHQKIYFNKFELQELEKRNPTLFELAQHVADKAHITVRVMGKNWINVASSNNEIQLMCPSEVFHIPGTDSDVVNHACSGLSCWLMYNEPNANPDKQYRPCWFRRWNDFVYDMKGV